MVSLAFKEDFRFFLFQLLKVRFLDTQEILTEANIKGIQVKLLVLSSSEQPGHMILSLFSETILIVFRASSGLPNSEDSVEEKIPNTFRLNELSA